MEISISKKLTNSDLQQIANEVINNVKEGYECAMETIGKCEALSKIAENIKKNIMAKAVEEFQKMKENKNNIVIGNFELEYLETGVRYDYSDDLIWQNISKEIDEVTNLFLAPLIKARKTREDILKLTFKSYTSFTKTIDVDTNTGEIFERKMPLKASTEIVRVKFR